MMMQVTSGDKILLALAFNSNKVETKFEDATKLTWCVAKYIHYYGFQKWWTENVPWAQILDYLISQNKGQILCDFIYIKIFHDMLLKSIYFVCVAWDSRLS